MGTVAYAIALLDPDGLPRPRVELVHTGDMPVEVGVSDASDAEIPVLGVLVLRGVGTPASSSS
jgi:hypothetical protein